MKEFWNNRYTGQEYVYGDQPNAYYKEKLAELNPGRILFPADGEGRNGVYAAVQGWEVDCFDISREGKRKAKLLADKWNTQINYQVGELKELMYEPESFDAIVLIFSHFPPIVRKEYHAAFKKLLKPGGYIILELFSMDHLKYNAVNPQVGGPRDEEMLYSLEKAQQDFDGLEFFELKQVDVTLSEGENHVGLGNVIRLFARKK